ncbi:hypothetical protein V6N13_036826 [Hibiscus sabdariffa]
MLDCQVSSPKMSDAYNPFHLLERRLALLLLVETTGPVSATHAGLQLARCYCRADSAYLCAGCDAQVHAANRVASRHERVWACERAPAAFLCKADAASLCTTCDAEIHSANPLARRHQRVPILPISGCLYGHLATDQGGQKMASETEDGFVSTNGDETIAEDEDEAASWLLLNPGKNGIDQNKGFLLTGEVDDYLDLVDYDSSVEKQFADQYSQQQQNYGVQRKNYGGDSVVPVQPGEAKDQFPQQQQQHQSFQYGQDYDSSKAAYSNNGSISHNVSFSSVDVSIVPESTTSDISSRFHTRGRLKVQSTSSPDLRF